MNIDLEKEIHEKYPVLVSKHIKKYKNRQAIKCQFYPNEKELSYNDGVGAYFPEEKRITNVLTQKYPNRCIIYTTSICFANCRHCSRKEKWKENYTFVKRDFKNAVSKIRQNPAIEEVILTGGDVLTNSNDDIKFMLNELSKVSHIRSIRIGTRVFSVNPLRVDQELVDILLQHNNVIILTQINHADEFTDETRKSLKMIQKCGIPILNQFVFLNNINNNYAIIRNLLLTCGENRIIPYYMYHCFNVKSTQFFRTDLNDAINIINSLVGNIGGWLIPKLIIIPEETGIKIPLAPCGLEEMNYDHIKARDFKNRTIFYRSNHKT